MKPDDPDCPKKRIKANCDYRGRAEPRSAFVRIDAHCKSSVSEDAEQVDVEARLDTPLELQGDICSSWWWVVCRCLRARSGKTVHFCWLLRICGSEGFWVEREVPAHYRYNDDIAHSHACDNEQREVIDLLREDPLSF